MSRHPLRPVLGHRIAVAVTVAVLGAAALPAATRPAAAAGAGEVEVVAGFYPLAWAAEQVGGKRVTVRNLTPAGTEPHDLELTPDQRDDLEDADLVLVLGRGFQPAVEDAAAARDRGTVELLDRLPIGKAGSGARGGRDGPDPHVWLDPRLMAAIVDETARALTAADPAGRARYSARAAALRERLAALDARFRTGLAECRRRVVVTAHDAFGYLAAAYDLDQVGVAGLSPDAEPDPKRLAELADLVAAKGVTTVFTEELVSPKIAQTLAREAGGVRTATLNPLEGLTDEELARGDDYVTVMDADLARLRKALDCT